MPDSDLINKKLDTIMLAKKKRDSLAIALFITLALIVGTWAVIVVSWFVLGDYPGGLVIFTQWLGKLIFGELLCVCVDRCIKYIKNGDARKTGE